MAVHQIAEGNLGQMVALQDGRIVPVPLAQAIAHLKLVPLESDIIQTARGLGICLG
jgi:hypothetical protein